MSRLRHTATEASAGQGIRRGRVFRPVLLMLVLAAVCWGFWTNTQKRLAFLAPQALFSDATQSVPAEQKEKILDLLATFKKDFGIPLEVHVRTAPPALAEQDASRMYLDIVPSRKRAYLFFPPLVRNAVGQSFLRDMEQAFAEEFAAGDWRQSLVPAVLAIRRKLAEVTR